jgi:rubrerythrin
MTVKAEELSEQQVKFLTKWFAQDEQYHGLSFAEALAKLRASQKERVVHHEHESSQAR